MDSDLQTTVLRLPQTVNNWDLVAKFLAFRKAVFVDDKGWPIFHTDEHEYDNYDGGYDPVYIVAHRGRAVVGGLRLKRTDGRFGSGIVTYSYMIRDAWLGLLPGMPQNLCSDEPPVSSSVWEMTRFVAAREADVVESLLVAANDFLFTEAATECLFLGSPAFPRLARTLGWQVKLMGEIVGNEDGRFVAFRCPVMDPASARAKCRGLDRLLGRGMPGTPASLL